MPAPDALRDLLARLRASRTHEGGRGRALEALAFALALPLAGQLAFPADPFGLGSGFPWLAVGPALFAARYGAGSGLLCAVLAAALAGAAFALPHPAYAEAPAALVALAIGTLLLGLLVGEAGDGWRRRALRAEAEGGYLRHRLERFSNDYRVLEVSHGQLEEYLAGQRLSLRGALERVRATLDDGEHDGGLGSGETLMAVFAQFCSVQVAGLYEVRAAGVVHPEPLAVHGAMGELPQFDPLLRLALAERRLVSVTSESAALERHDGGLLAVVPIVDARDRLHALLVIRDMHFMAFQQRNLNVLALLASYVGDLIGRPGALAGDAAARFAGELDTALRFARSHAMPSSLVRLQLVAHPGGKRVADYLAGRIRGLDSSWVPPRAKADGAWTVIVLLPLVGARGADAWLARVAEELRERHGVALADILERTRVMPLEARHEREECLAFAAEPDEPFAPGETPAFAEDGEGARDDRAA